MRALRINGEKSLFQMKNVINSEHGRTNGKTSFIQRNPGSVYSIKRVSSMFGGIEENAHWQRAFVIVMLAPWNGVLLDTRLCHLLFALIAL
ncbi:UNVERIFIED_CONTAM: hypothetical protein NCL1_11322 [Trichonephila clavipes]